LSIRESMDHSRDIFKTFIDSTYSSQVHCVMQTFSCNIYAHDNVRLLRKQHDVFLKGLLQIGQLKLIWPITLSVSLHFYFKWCIDS